MPEVRPTLLLLHAFPLSSALYVDVVEPLAEVVDLVLPEFRGFGGSQVPDDEPALDVYADDAVAVLDRLGVERAIIGGTSMGGYVAMAFCRRYPGRVAGLLLADTKASSDSAMAAETREKMAANVLAEDSVRMVVEEVHPKLLGDTTFAQRPAIANLVRGWVEQASPEAVAWAQRAMARRPDSIETLQAMDVPGLVIVGDEDRLASLSDAQAMAEALPQGRLVVLPKAGHLSAIETPEAFAQAVVAWLTQERSLGR